MRNDLKQLLHLQSLDLRMRELRRNKQLKSDHLETLRGKIAEEEKAVEAEKEHLQQEGVRIKTLELQASGKKDQIEKYQQQLLTIRSNKEYQALLHEIEGLKADIRMVEDQTLDLMEKAEADRKKMESIKEDLDRAREQLRDEEAAAEKEFSQIEKDLEELQGKRTRLADLLEEELREKYERIFNHKPDKAVVSVVGKVCQGCNMQLTGQVLNDLQKDDEIHYCENCGRLIYLPE
jgi:predicted  nucleic acid-binding Zn-ribbon protein